MDREKSNELKSGYMYCIAGRPGIGKTTLAKKIIMDAKEKEVTVFSLEMDKEKFMKGIEDCQHITLYDNAVTIDKIESIVRNKNTDVVVIDYFQLVKGEGNSLHEVYSATSYRLKKLASETDTAIIIICQLNRRCEQRIDNRPCLRDLESGSCGSIVQLADCIAFLYDEHYYNQNRAHTEEIIIAKNRGGDCKTVFLNPVGNKKFW